MTEIYLFILKPSLMVEKTNQDLLKECEESIDITKGATLIPNEVKKWKIKCPGLQMQVIKIQKIFHMLKYFAAIFGSTDQRSG